jgi:hypothetical protein
MRYGIYFLMLDGNKHIGQLFREIVENNNYKLDNYYYSSVREALDKLFNSPNAEGVVAVIYQEDTTISGPGRYKLLNKHDVYEDFPTCKVIKENL